MLLDLPLHPRPDGDHRILGDCNFDIGRQPFKEKTTGDRLLDINVKRTASRNHNIGLPRKALRKLDRPQMTDMPPPAHLRWQLITEPMASRLGEGVGRHLVKIGRLNVNSFGLGSTVFAFQGVKGQRASRAVTM
jgi:hypothetical protein